MKNTSLLIALMFFSINAGFAQQYFDTSSFYYYLQSDSTKEFQLPYTIPASGNIIPICVTKSNYSIDSVLTLELNKEINFDTTILHGCHPQNIAGILGHRIVENASTLTFYNQKNEPIQLHLQDSIWLGFDNDSLQAKFIRQPSQQKNMFDSSYMVQRFKCYIYFKDSTINNLNPFNEKEIEISKGFGLILTPELSDFPYSKVATSHYLSGKIDTKTKKKTGVTIYPQHKSLFEIGDEFHTYRQSSGRGNVPYSGYSERTWLVENVLVKTIYPDSTIYTYSFKSVYKYGISYIQGNRYDSLSITNDTLQYVAKDNYPSPIISEQILFPSYPYNHQFKTVAYLESNFGYGYSYQDSLWCITEILYPFNSTTFNGIGITNPKAFYDSGSEGFVKSEIVYVKRGVNTWGKPFPANVGINEIINHSTDVTIYPNPAKDEITITTLNRSNPFTQISFFDIAGKLLLTNHNAGTDVLLHLPTLTAGVYFVNITFQNSLTVTRKLIIH